jgi:hypothetical protein
MHFGDGSSIMSHFDSCYEGKIRTYLGWEIKRDMEKGLPSLSQNTMLWRLCHMRLSTNLPRWFLPQPSLEEGRLRSSSWLRFPFPILGIVGSLGYLFNMTRPGVAFAYFEYPSGFRFHSTKLYRCLGVCRHFHWSVHRKYSQLIDIRRHYVRELDLAGIIKLVPLGTHDMVTDALKSWPVGYFCTSCTTCKKVETHIAEAAMSLKIKKTIAAEHRAETEINSNRQHHSAMLLLPVSGSDWDELKESQRQRNL